jgi:16S rRNA (uracil1498-N3)-methyltransferase
VTVHRFFVDPADIRGDRFPLPLSIRHQVRTVLRLGDGDGIVLLPGDGSELACRLDGDACVVDARRRAGGEAAHRLTVVQALLKGDALEDVVRQGTEVGVHGFELVVSERCVVRDLSPRKLERLRHIAREAAEQSERGLVPAVSAPVPLAAALRPGGVLLFERHDGERLVAVGAPPAIVIGPEGGFTPAEVAHARSAGVAVAGLGPRVLRSQTVAVAAAAVILSAAGDFG